MRKLKRISYGLIVIIAFALLHFVLNNYVGQTARYNTDNVPSLLSHRINGKTSQVHQVLPVIYTSSHFRHACRTQQLPLLILFTTFKPTPKKTTVYLQTLRNWASLRPEIQPVLYTQSLPNDTLLREALDLGWLVFEVPDETNGLPVLQSMFAHAMKSVSGHFYGFSNGDILFTEDLITTLCYLDVTLPTLLNSTQFLMTGIRTNVNFKEKKSFSDWNAVRNGARSGKLFIPQSQDFFISGQSSFPWAKIPPFVVGRIGYDNWIIAYAMSERIPVIDLTETVISAHLTDEEGDKAGATAGNLTNSDINMNLVPKTFNFGLGNTYCMPFQTRWNALKDPELFYREVTRYKCKGQQHRIVNGKLKRNYWFELCSKCRGSL